LLLVLLGAGTYARLIPLPVLAGILITVGFGIIDYKGLKHLLRVPRADAVILIVVLTLTVFVDLLQAVAVGMVLASILFMKKMSDVAEGKAAIGSIADFHREEAWSDELLIPEELQDKIYIKHFDGPIFFGFASKFQEMTRAMPDVNIVIMRMRRVPYIDQSGIYAIEDAVMELQGKGVTVLMTGMQEQPKDMLLNVDLIPNLVPEENLFPDFRSCIAALQDGKLTI
ncbi:MAG: STAS domain-containing protein, partial [Methylococcales bacterium]